MDFRDFSELAIGITTVTSDAHVIETISAIRDTLPKAQIIIADDSALTNERNEVYAAIVAEGPHTVYHLPYGTRYGVRANIVANRCYRPYLLLAKDSYDFRPQAVRNGIMTLTNRLEEHTGYSIAGGRVNNTPREYWLDDRGDQIAQHLVPDRGALAYSCIECDLVGGPVLIRKEVFHKLKFDESDLGAVDSDTFLLDAKRAGYKTMFVPGVNINLQQEKPNVKAA